MIGFMLFPMNSMPFSPVCNGDGGSFSFFGTTRNTTTHAATRGT
jgi:hypothetical protein